MTEIRAKRKQPASRPQRARRHRLSTGDRRAELVRIANRLIAERGLEGLRTRHVAAKAGIDTGTLHYHFPSKEALIQAVVEALANDFRNNRASSGAEPVNALEELRQEILDAALRLRETPDQLLVFFELRVRGSRDATIAKILTKLQQGWESKLVSLMNRGIQQGSLRTDVPPETAARLIRAEIEGMALTGLTERGRIDEIASALCTQMEAWLTKPTM